MYDTMAVWETDTALAAQSDLMSDFANAWQAAHKVVYSTTWPRCQPPTPGSNATSTRARGTRPEGGGEQRSERLGPNLAAQAFKAGLVDECHLFIWPVILGGGKPAVPTDTRAELALLDERRFGNGVVQLRYRPL